MRRIFAVLAVAVGVAISSAVPVGAASKKDALAVDLRFVVVGETITDAFVTGNDRWFHTKDTVIDVAGSGTFGEEAVVGTGQGTANSHTSLPADPALPPGFGDDGWAHVGASVSLISLGSEGELSCTGWFHLRRSPTDDVFPFAYEDGMAKWKCSDGRRVDAAVDGFFEIDPVFGAPVFILHVTGEVR